MRKITIRDLHIKTGEWVRKAASGDTVVITDRGQPVAPLPLSMSGILVGPSLDAELCLSSKLSRPFQATRQPMFPRIARENDRLRYCFLA